MNNTNFCEIYLSNSSFTLPCSMHSVCQLYILRAYYVVLYTYYVSVDPYLAQSALYPFKNSPLTVEPGERSDPRPIKHARLPVRLIRLRGIHRLRLVFCDSHCINLIVTFSLPLYYCGLFCRGLLELTFVLDWTIILMAKAM